MPFTVNDLGFYYSGGAGNSNPTLSLGGVVSSSRITSQQISAPVNVTGVTINSAANNAQGSGLLSWSPGTNTLSWQPPTSIYTYNMSVTADGTYVIGGSDGLLVVTCVYASMAVVYKQDALNVTAAIGNVFDNVGPADSLAGSTEYRCIYVKNTNATTTVNDAKVWIKQLTTGPDEIHIGLDPVGNGNGSSTGVATTIANETTAPAGVTFSQPTTSGVALSIGTLAPGECRAIWERRTVPAETTGNIAANQSTLAVSVTI